MRRKIGIQRLAKEGLMLALFCVFGMISIPLGTNIKLSLQLLILYIICLTSSSVIDCLVVSSLYLVIGLFLPVYAGFNSSISPTFGYVISFVVISPIMFYINKIPNMAPKLRMILACLTGLIICYIIGTIYMMMYFSLDIKSVVLISVVPYIPFDLIKILLATNIVSKLPEKIINI